MRWQGSLRCVGSGQDTVSSRWKVNFRGRGSMHVGCQRVGTRWLSPLMCYWLNGRVLGSPVVTPRTSPNTLPAPGGPKGPPRLHPAAPRLLPAAPTPNHRWKYFIDLPSAFDDFCRSEGKNRWASHKGVVRNYPGEKCTRTKSRTLHIPLKWYGICTKYCSLLSSRPQFHLHCCTWGEFRR